MSPNVESFAACAMGLYHLNLTSRNDSTSRAGIPLEGSNCGDITQLYDWIVVGFHHGLPKMAEKRESIMRSIFIDILFFRQIVI